MSHSNPKSVVQERKGSFLWEVKGGNATMYLAGTVHLVPESYFPLKGEIINRFDECRNLVLEVILEDTDSDNIEITPDILNNKELTYEDGDSLYNHFPKDKILRLRDYMVKNKLCPLELSKKFYKLKPSVVNYMLFYGMCKRAGVNLKYMGIDGYFLNRAREMGKNLMELETKEFQNELLAKLHGRPNPENAQKLPTEKLPIIDSGLFGKFIRMKFMPWLFSSYVTHVGGLYGNYSRVLKKRKVANALGSPLFGTRDEEMCKKLTELLKTRDSYFVAVGAGHLIGDESITDRLEKQGFTIVRIC